MWKEFNANPVGKRCGDCTVRAISAAMQKDWHTTFLCLCLQGYIMCDMPSSDSVWGAYLRRKGYKRTAIEEAAETYSVRDFCKDHPEGTYILAISGHVVCVKDGNYYDSWDSGNEIPIYYWERKNK